MEGSVAAALVNAPEFIAARPLAALAPAPSVWAKPPAQKAARPSPEQISGLKRKLPAALAAAICGRHAKQAAKQRKREEQERRAALRRLQETDEVRACRSQALGAARESDTHTHTPQAAYLELQRSNKDARIREIMATTDGAIDAIGRTMRAHAEQARESAEAEACASADCPLPAGLALMPHQRAGLQWLLGLEADGLSGLLADEMGLGKTIQLIALLASLHKRDGGGVSEQNPGGHVYMVLAPNSTLHNWEAEFAKWAPQLRLLLFAGSQEQRAAKRSRLADRSSWDVVLTSFDLGLIERRALGGTTGSSPNYRLITVDEGHRLKNAQSKLTTALTTMYTSERRLLLTGTPLHNSITQLWSLMSFLCPSIFGAQESSFESWFSVSASSGVSASHEALSEEEELLLLTQLQRLLRPFILRRVKNDVLKTLLPKIEHNVICEMSALQTAMCTALNGEEGAPALPFHRGTNPLMKCRQVCISPFLLHEGPLSEGGSMIEDVVAVSGKFHTLSQILPPLKAANHRVLIFSQFVKALDLLERYCESEGHECCRIDGSTEFEVRQSQIKEYNRPQTPKFAFLLSTRAGGQGINLASADTVILFDSDWNPQLDRQAQDRVHRIGQTKQVLILRLISGPADQQMLRVSEQKDLRDAKLVRSGNFGHEEELAGFGEREDQGQGFRQQQEQVAKVQKDARQTASFVVPSAEQLSVLISRGEQRIVPAEGVAAICSSLEALPPTATQWLADLRSSEAAKQARIAGKAKAVVCYTELEDGDDAGFMD